MPGLPHLIPAPVGTLVASSFTPSDIAYDIAIDGVPFIFANTAENPLVRKTTPYKRQQFDNAPESGEQTLDQAWWLRSQASFHSGAGQLYFEPAGGQDEFSRTRFHSSKNVDPWTQGKVTRLPDTTSIFATAGNVTGMVAASKTGVDYVLIAVGTTLTGWSSATGLTTTYTWTGTGTILSLVTDGSSYYVADNVGVWKGPVDNGSVGVKIWNTGSSPVALGWVKQRLMAGIGAVLYELVGAGPGLPAAKYTHPNTSWVWSAFAEGPTSILAAGYAGGNSGVLKLTLDTQGVSPTLTSGSMAVSMPTGEQILCMQDYLGSFVALGTSTGVWVGTYDAFYGNFSLGPKVVTTGTPVHGLAGRDRFVYATCSQFIDSESGLLRIDLSQVVDKAGHLAYATDLICPTAQMGDAAAVAVLPTAGRVVFAINAAGVFKEGTTAGTGRDAWIKTSRVRHSTVEPKLYKLCRLRGQFTGATLKVYGETPSLGETLIVNASNPGLDPAEFALGLAQDEWLSLRIEMDGAAAAELRSYQLKSVPAVTRGRTLQVVLSCRDSEKDRNGVEFGREGYGWERLGRLEAAEGSNDEVLLQRFTPLGTLTERVFIDEIQFLEATRPKPLNGIGGVIVLTARTVV